MFAGKVTASAAKRIFSISLSTPELFSWKRDFSVSSRARAERTRISWLTRVWRKVSFTSAWPNFLKLGIQSKQCFIFTPQSFRFRSHNLEKSYDSGFGITYALHRNLLLHHLDCFHSSADRLNFHFFTPFGSKYQFIMRFKSAKVKCLQFFSHPPDASRAYARHHYRSGRRLLKRGSSLVGVNNCARNNPGLPKPETEGIVSSITVFALNFDNIWETRLNWTID